MKILHVTPNATRAYGGPTYSLVAYSMAAMSAGASVTIASPVVPDADRRWMTQQLPEVPFLSFSAYGAGAFLASPALQYWLRRSGAAFDVVHVHGLLNPVSSLASRACLRRGWPLVIRPFGTLSRFTFSHRRGLLKRLYMSVIEEQNLLAASAIHFTTNAERDSSTWHAIEWGDRACVVPPPWIAATRMRPPSDSATVLFVSRLHPVKNIELLLDAWPVVVERVPAARLVIAGDGEASYVRDLRARAKPLEAFVSFAGHVDGAAKDQLFTRAALLALPSFHENFGIAVLEALAAGLPVVITPEVQLSEFVTAHALGTVAEPSAQAFGDAIATTLADRAMRDRCSRDGPALVERHFSPQVIGDGLMKMYWFALNHSHEEAVNA